MVKVSWEKSCKTSGKKCDTYQRGVVERGKVATAAAEVAVAGADLTDEMCKEYVHVTSVVSTYDISG